MKTILFVIDGLGDRPIPKLNNKTPLEAARTPNLDKMAEQGVCGLVNPFLLSFQKKPASDTCHLALFGYDPRKYYFNRGPYEAAGAGLRVSSKDLVLRANFATVDENNIIVDRRAGRIDNTESLVKALSKIKGVKIKKLYEHRLTVVIKGPGLSDMITGNDPYEKGVKIGTVAPCIPRARKTARLVSEFLKKSREILKNHPFNKGRSLPANCLLIRGAGFLGTVPSFKKRYGLKSCVVAGGNLYKGIAKVLGMKIIEVKGATGKTNTNLKAKISAVKKAVKSYDFVFCHIKAADSLAEDGNYSGKKRFIEKIDKALKPVLELKNIKCIVTADHSTCSLMERHCLDLIPLLVKGKGKDKIKEFSEKACAKGLLGTIEQIDLFKRVVLK